MSSSTTPTPGLPAAAAGKKRATPEGGHAPAPPSQRIKARKTAQSIVVQPVVASTATKKPQQQQQQQPNAHILRSVLPARIAESRAFELTAMHAVMRRSTDLAKSRAFQKVPRYLRRRAASHNPLKVPRALRDRALREIDIPNDDQRRRRKPKALRRKPRSDFISRQRRNGRWLETHLWHAKRFHLVPRWGWKVPDRPTQKGDRAAYRSAEHAVVARDLSWTSRYAFSGASADDIATVVSAVADPLGPRVGAARYRHGARAVDLDLYDAYPRGFLGPATAVWRPFSSSDPTHVLWLALHPAAEDAFLLAVAAALDRLKMTSVLVDQVTDVGRIELTGPKAMAIVHSVLHPARSAMTDAENAAWDTTRGICSPAALAPGQVLGVRVWDPRLSYPPRRPNYHQHQGQAATTESGLPVPTAALPLWSSTDRAALLAAKHPESALNARRAKALIPGTRLRPRSNHDAVVPILAIRSGTVGGTSAPSLTLLIPTGYVLAVWRALTYAGARPIGERCTRSLAHEAAVPMWPYDWPGTLAHAADAAETGAAEEAKWRSRPRGKRVPYTRLEVDAPFVADWARVAGNGDGSVWVVPRTAHRPVVAELAATKPHPRGGGTSASAADRVSAVAARLASMAGPTHAPDAGKLLGSSVTGGNIPLVQTSLTFPGRGAASPNAMVYEMPARDVQAWERIVKRHAWDEAAEVNGARERVSTGKGDDEDVEYRPRKLVGYVTSGRFSLAVGRTRAIACVAMEAVLTNKWVLVRETSSPVVYPALVTVLNAVGP